ncbi:snRNA-activating protein complex subunit 2 isoform X2 [Mastacembelus armatus]|uniref:Small nuclear RNA activating complex, polypeptide 2 n=1 Tax=Mastacembelus armatus TaxID=205130 RepID=A0A3Q3MHT2_9TELE|nr:snRNA-activating protein complex subunit 2 isoform X2 [Mastacembelus armatus]
MKPPPRTRAKPNCNPKLDLVSQRSDKVPSKWKRAEQRKLLDALKKLNRTAGGHRDIDYAFLRKYVTTRSNLELLVVSSTEPQTLTNCDPPQVQKPPTQDRKAGRTIPLRPMPGLRAQGEHLGTKTNCPLLVLKTPAPTMGPAKRLPAPSKVVRVPIRKITAPQQHLSTIARISSVATSYLPATKRLVLSPATTQPAWRKAGKLTRSSVLAAESNIQIVGSSVIQANQQPSEQHPTTDSTTSTSKSTSSSPQTHHSFSTSSFPLVSSTASSSSTTLSTAAPEFRAGFGCNSKYSTKDNPRAFGVKGVVDFERIYRYLSLIHKPNEECYLTPMESAILLDLLMSLPEELSLLDCNKLHKHLIQVYQYLSSPADSRIAKRMFKDLEDAFSTQTEALSSQDSNRIVSHQNTASQSGDADMMELCPPLNPFMVPIQLLMRR